MVPATMNRKLIFSFVILLSLLCKAQTFKYHPFPEGTGIWKHESTETCGQSSNNFSCKSGYQYVQKGDTLISSKHYTKLHKEGWTSECSHFPPYYCMNPVFYNTYTGATRNDTTTKKVLFVASGSTVEIILYDFSVKKGDTLKSTACNGQVITLVDSVLVGNSYHKRFTVESGFNIIEGIGAVGINYEWGDMFTCGPCVCPYFWTFKCFSEKGVVKLGDPGCTIYTAIPADNLKSFLKVYPNPSQSSFTFEVSGGIHNLQLYVYNSLGRRVIADNVSQPTFKINLDLLPAGLYLYTVEKDGAIKATGKLFKE